MGPSTFTHDIPFTNIISSGPRGPVEQYSNSPPSESQFCEHKSSPVWIRESSFQEEFQDIHNVPTHPFLPRTGSTNHEILKG